MIYNYKGKDYPVGFHRNIYPERELRDTILWVTKEKWRNKGNLKLRVYYSNELPKERLKWNLRRIFLIKGLKFEIGEI